MSIRYNELRNLRDILLLERHVRHLNISHNPWGCLSEACDLDALCSSITYQVYFCGSWNESENEVHCVSEDIVPIVSESSIGEMVVRINSGEPQQEACLHCRVCVYARIRSYCAVHHSCNLYTCRSFTRSESKRRH